MENSKKNPYKNKPKRSNFFLTCFGFSFEPVLEGENPSKMVINITPTKEKMINRNRKKKNLIRWFSSSTSSMNTVPVDPTPSSSEKAKKAPAPAAAFKSKKRTGDDNSSSTGVSDRKRSTRTRKSPSSKGDDHMAYQKPPHRDPDTSAIATALSPEENVSDQTMDGIGESIILGTAKKAGHVEAGKNDTWQKRQSFARKIDAIRKPESLPGSPEIKPKSNRMAPSRTTSFPVDKLADKPVVKLKTIGEKPSKETDPGDRDSIIGMSIMLVTLLIFLLWGRVCAVLCTCAWLYFVPLLRTMVGRDETAKPGSSQNEPDFDSEEYKKRVVLEGFLDRRRRSGP